MNTIIALVWLLLCISGVAQGKITGSIFFIATSIFWGFLIVSNSINKFSKEIQIYTEVVCGAVYGNTEILRQRRKEEFGEKKEETKNE